MEQGQLEASIDTTPAVFVNGGEMVGELHYLQSKNKDNTTVDFCSWQLDVHEAR